jgi:threonine/homoserine/homoserine lactone efflux protein
VGVHVAQFLVFCVVTIISKFFFNVQLLITPSVSSNFLQTFFKLSKQLLDTVGSAGSFDATPTKTREGVWG